MGTVLSFSPRERRPIYTTTHHHHHGSGTTISSSSNSSSDFQHSTSYAYEQINNAKNRGENIIKQPMQYLTVPNQFHHHHNGNGVLFNANSTTTNILNNNLSCSNSSLDDNARILSEKNAIEKNLKKHSLFINALSWKRLSSSHGKKKHLEANNNVKNKSVTTSATFRQDVVHPMVVVNEKKKFQHQQQVQLITTTSTTTTSKATNGGGGGQTLFYDPGDPKSIVALDLERAANNANNLHHHHHHQIDKIVPKNSHPLRPIQLIENHGQQNAPRKTIIQVSSQFIYLAC